MKKSKIFIACVMVGSSMTSFAQSSVQCSVGPDGKLNAALVWQNTLGVERANALCKSEQTPKITQSHRDQSQHSHVGNVASYQPIYSHVPHASEGRHSPAQAAEEEFVPLR